MHEHHDEKPDNTDHTYELAWEEFEGGGKYVVRKIGSCVPILTLDASMGKEINPVTLKSTSVKEAKDEAGRIASLIEVFRNRTAA